MIRALILALSLLVPLAALEAGAPIPVLDAVEWVDDQGPVRGRPLVILLIAVDAPQSQQTAIELGRLQRQQRDRLQVVALGAEDVSAFRRDLGIEMGYPAGRADSRLFDLLSADARGLPHSLLVAEDGTLLWQGHPRLLPQIIGQKLK